MTIDKAIEILKGHALSIDLAHEADLHASIHLGIEALKWRRAKEIRDGPSMYLPLPGETLE